MKIMIITKCRRHVSALLTSESMQLKNTMKEIRRLATLTILALLLLGCSGNNGTSAPANSPESPELAAQEWLQAVLNGDGVTLLERTCAAERATVQELGLLRQLTAWAGQELLGERGSGSTSEVTFNVQLSSGDDAIVVVTGEVISAVGAAGTSQPIDETWRMRREGNQWRWCGLVSENAVMEDTINRELQEAWTLQTGDIKHLMISESGTIYGLITNDPWRHAVISPEGELLGVNDIDTEGRITSGLVFGSGTNWVPQPNGALLIEGYGETVYLLPSGRMQFLNEPLRPNASFRGGVSHTGTTTAFLMYTSVDGATGADGRSTGLLEYYEIERDRGLVLNTQVQLPNSIDYDLLTNFERQVYVLAYRLRSSGEIVVVNHTGTEVFRELPAGARSDRFVESHVITEWGDVWLRYTAVNEIGAEQGQRILRISNTGEATFFEHWPWHTYRNIVYLPNRNEILAYAQDGLFLLDRDLLEVDRFSAPPGNFPGTVLIGFDGNLYVFNGGAKTLTKFVR